MPESFVKNEKANARQCYETWHDRYGVDANADTPWHTMIKNHLSPVRDVASKRILEIGCGRGGFSCWLAQQAHVPTNITAVDFSITAVKKGEEYARAAGLSKITWEVGDIQEIAHADGSFDTVISCETIEHIPEPRKALSELRRVLKPGGRLFLTTPNYLNIMGLYRLYLPLRGRVFTEEGQPINNFMLLPRTQEWVRRADLRIITTTSMGHYLPWPGRPPIELPIPGIAGSARWFGFHSLILAERSAPSA